MQKKYKNTKKFLLIFKETDSGRKAPNTHSRPLYKIRKYSVADKKSVMRKA